MDKQSRKKQNGAEAKETAIVEVMPFSYQPSKAELEADVSIPTTPEKLAKAVLRTLTVRTKSP